MLNRSSLAALAFFAGCSSSAQPTGIERLSCSPDSTLTYENFGKSMVESACMSCHDSESPNLATQAKIQSHVSSILEAAVYTDAMPADQDLTIDERRLLGEWLACGAK